MLLSAASFSGTRPPVALSAASPALPRPRLQFAQRRRHLLSVRWSTNDSISSSSGSSSSGSGSSSRGSGSSSSGSSSSGSSSSGSSSSGSSELQASTPEQVAAAVRVVALSREASQHRSKTYSSDEQLRQRILFLLQLGFSVAAIEQHIRNRKGGPYVAWETIGELVALLRQEGFSQQQLDGMLEGSSVGSSAGGVYSRSPADIDANLAWLRQQFGLKPAGLAKVCSRSPPLLQYKAETLQANWRAIVEAHHPTAAAILRLATVLQAGSSEVLYLKPATVGDKVKALQELLGLPDEDMPDKFGALARLFGLDLSAVDDGPVQRFELLQELTGLSKRKLGALILQSTLLRSPTATLLRKYGAIVQALGGDAATAKLLLSRYPDALHGSDDRMARNLCTLQRLGCSSPEAAVHVLVANGRLAKLDLEQPAFAARVAYWRQTYELESAEAAMLKCVEMLHRSLRTVAPRVAFWRSCRPGQPLPHCNIFTSGDAAFCKRQRLPAEQYSAFKQQWLASEEGQQVCCHERQQGAAATEVPGTEAEE